MKRFRARSSRSPRAAARTPMNDRSLQDLPVIATPPRMAKLPVAPTGGASNEAHDLTTEADSTTDEPLELVTKNRCEHGLRMLSVRCRPMCFTSARGPHACCRDLAAKERAISQVQKILSAESAQHEFLLANVTPVRLGLAVVARKASGGGSRRAPAVTRRPLIRSRHGMAYMCNPVQVLGSHVDTTLSTPEQCQHLLACLTAAFASIVTDIKTSAASNETSRDDHRDAADWVTLQVVEVRRAASAPVLCQWS